MKVKHQFDKSMKKFDKTELKLLRGNLTAIGMSIPSSRSRTGYISRRYVYSVIMGKANRDNKTTRAIIQKAEKIIETLKA